MRIAVIGTGRIGATIGNALAKAGHEVTFGSRHPESTTGLEAKVADLADALSPAQAVLLALPAAAVADVLAEHAGALDGKLVIDATNNMGALTANASQQILSAVPGARYVRAFNTLGWENFADPLFESVPADLFFSAAAADREAVEELITGVGLRPAYLGEGKHDVVDAALPLWFALTQARGNRHIAFRVLEK
ncbi:MAG: NAD(P)-binding domain-containing protein [Actinomycetota bacterium]|nr:NAD(P)-binding domain-containing protein [Actinomycetota bacterium]